MNLVVALLLQTSAVQVTAETRRLYEPYRQCLQGQTALLAKPDGETAGLDRARTNCMAQNLSAGSNALFAEIRAGATQAEAIEHAGALRREIEQEAVARARSDNRPLVPGLPAARPVPFGGVEVPDPVAPALRHYGDCYGAEMRRLGALPVILRATYRASVEAAIAACAAAREGAMQEAVAALAGAPGYQDSERRRARVARVFDETDDQHRNLIEIMDAIRRERGTNAQD